MVLNLSTSSPTIRRVAISAMVLVSGTVRVLEDISRTIAMEVVRILTAITANSDMDCPKFILRNSCRLRFKYLSILCAVNTSFGPILI